MSVHRMQHPRSVTPFEGHASSCSPDPALAVQAHLFGALSPLTEMSNEQACIQFEQSHSQSDGPIPEEEEGSLEEGPSGEVQPSVDQQAEMDALTQDTLARQQRIEEECRRI